TVAHDVDLQRYFLLQQSRGLASSMRNVRPTDDSTASSVRSVLVVVISIAALLVFVAGAVRPHTRELSHGFAAYYTSARLVASGEDPANFYDNRWFLEQTIDAGFT